MKINPPYMKLLGNTAALPRWAADELLAMVVSGQAPSQIDVPKWDEKAKGYEVVDGVAVIGVKGILFQALELLKPIGFGPFYMTGYDGIRQNLLDALEDPSVKGIVYDVNSPGGMVSGLFGLCDLIRDARSIKPSVAILSDSAYSAAYAIASSAGGISVPETGGVGSIGVIATYMDVSEFLKKAGIKYHFFISGEKKADGHPEIPLSEQAQRDIQMDVDELGKIFIQAVAENRGLPSKDVKNMEAGTFLGKKGVDVGLADSVYEPDIAFWRFRKNLNR